MPNWCRTEIRYLSDNKKSLSDFEKKLNEWKEQETYYLETLALKSSVAQKKDNRIIDEEGHEVYCRGQITDISLENDYLYIEIWEAWSPHLRIWDLLRKKYLPNAELLFTADEEGEDILFTNDSSYEGIYCIDILEDWFSEEDFLKVFNLDVHGTDEKTLADMLRRILHSDKTDIDELISNYENSEYYEYFIIRKWDYDTDIECLM